MRPVPMASRAFLAVLSVIFLVGGIAGCSKEEPAPGPMVKKMAPRPNVAPPPKSAVVEEKKLAPAPVYDPTGRRDPFVSFIKTEREKLKVDYKALPPLERQELNEFKYVGAIWERKGARALVEDAEGKGYSVLVGSRIGRNGGVVVRITDKEIVVKEEFPGTRGRKVSRESTLQLTTAGGN
jgi:type IV pilus assembly protein PilP